MADRQMSEHLKQLFAGAREAVRPLLPQRFRGGAPVVPVVRLSGVIGGPSLRGMGLSLNGINPALERAFKVRGAKAVALSINSPGGSPVQSALIAARIRAPSPCARRARSPW